VKYFVVLLLLLGTISCGRNTNDETIKSQLEDDFTGLPVPSFDTGIDELLNILEKRYQAEKVEISRPYEFISGQSAADYWLKISLLNPEIPQQESDSFGQFAKSVSHDVYSHLKNVNKFNKIEISVTQKAGKIVSYSSTISTMIFLDSLGRHN